MPTLIKQICRCCTAVLLSHTLFTSSLLAQEFFFEPGSGENLTSTTTFSWSAGEERYFLSLGFEPGTDDIFSSGFIDSTTLSVTVTDIPTSVRVYAEFWRETGFETNFGYIFDFVYNNDLDLDGVDSRYDINPGSYDPLLISSENGYAITISASGRVVSLESDKFLSSAADLDRSEAQTMSNLLYQHFEDDFDFIIYASKLRTPFSSARYSGIFIRAKNDVMGIGQSLHDNTFSFGSKGKLQGVTHLSGPSGLTGGPSLHELAHNWANHIPLLSDSGSHWGANKNIGGQLGGWEPGSLEERADGNYQAHGPGADGFSSWGSVANGGNGLPFSQFELYLMGLIEPEEIGHDIKVAADFNWVDRNNGVFSASRIDTFIMDDIIKSAGVRVPDSSASQKSFRAMYVILTDAPLTRAEWLKFDSDVYRFSVAGTDNNQQLYNFWEATGTRASIKMDGLHDSALPGKFTPGASVKIESTTNPSLDSILTCQNLSLNNRLTIAATAPFSLNCDFLVDENLIGENGDAFVVVDAHQYGLFQLNAAGSYGAWDGTIAGLRPALTTTLSDTLTLEPFENFVFADEGVSSALLKIYFAYAPKSTDELIYSPEGITVVIE